MTFSAIILEYDFSLDQRFFLRCILDILVALCIIGEEYRITGDFINLDIEFVLRQYLLKVI